MNRFYKKLISSVLAILMFLAFFTPSAVFAAEEASDTWGEPIVSITNGIVEVVADKQTGRFIAKTIEGVPGKESDNNKDLMYADRFRSPETSYTSIRIDGEDYIYGNSYGFMGAKGHYVTAPYIDNETKSIISEWSINNVVIRQRLSLVADRTLSSVGNVYISYDVINRSGMDKEVGIRLLVDTKIGDVDGPALTIPGAGFIYKETEFKGDEVPSLWYAYNQYVGPDIIAMGFISGEGLTKPDTLQFAAWEDVSQTKWDYEVDPNKSIIQVKVNGVDYTGQSGNTINFGEYPENSTIDYSVKDSCALLYWKPFGIEAGKTTTINTAYGVGDASNSVKESSYRMNLEGTDKLNMNLDRNGYTVDNVNIELTLDNNFDTSVNLNNIEITLELPEELELVQGEQNENQINITKGEYFKRNWKVKPTVQEKYKISSYSILFKGEGIPTQKITKLLIMEGMSSDMPTVKFTNLDPGRPFYIEDTNRSVSITGDGFDLFASAVSQLAEIKVINSNDNSKQWTIPVNNISYISESMINIIIPDALPVGEYDLFVSVNQATQNKNDEKTFSKGIIISDDAKYSLNTATEIEIPIELDSGAEVIESVKIYGKFQIGADKKTYTSVNNGSVISINNALKFAGGAMIVYYDPQNPQDTKITASSGSLWCDIVDESKKSITSTYITNSGFDFEFDKYINDESRRYMTFDASGFSNFASNVSYLNIPVSIDSVKLKTYGVDISGSFGILNPLMYTKSTYLPSSDSGVDSSSLLGEGFFTADVENLIISENGMEYIGEVAFEMPFVISLFVGANATLSVNTEEEHFVVEAGIGLGDAMPISMSLLGRIGFRKGRIDELYASFDSPVPVTLAPPIPIAIGGLSGGLSNLSFAGAFPITAILGIKLQDSTGIEVLGNPLIGLQGELTVSPFHLEGSIEAELFMIKLAEANAKFVWHTWNDDIEKRGLKIDARFQLAFIGGRVLLSYFEGEDFIGRAELNLQLPNEVPVVGGVSLAGVMGEITNKSIAASANALGVDIGIRYYFATNKVEFLELVEEMNDNDNAILVDYQDECIVEFGYNFVPVNLTSLAGVSNSSEMNLSDNSDTIIIFRMNEEQYNNLNGSSIQIVSPIGEIFKVELIEASEVVSKTLDATSTTLFGVKQVIEETNDFMVSVPISKDILINASGENRSGSWTIITDDQYEISPYTSLTNANIDSFVVNQVDNSLSASWELSNDPDKFRVYAVSANDENLVKSGITETQISNDPSVLWGFGRVLYGEEVDEKTAPDGSIINGNVTYTEPKDDTQVFDFNMPTGKYYIYARADRGNSTPVYSCSVIDFTNSSAPSAPSDMKAEYVGNSNIKLSWDIADNIAEYYIYQKGSNNSAYDYATPSSIYTVARDEKGVSINGNRAEVIIPKTEANRMYYFDVRAVKEDNTNKYMGDPVSSSVKTKAVEKISVVSDIKATDSKLYSYNCDYATNTNNIALNASSQNPLNVKVASITSQGNKVLVESIPFVYNEDSKIYMTSQNFKLSDGLNNIEVTYTNVNGDTFTEEYNIEVDKNNPTLVVTEVVGNADNVDNSIMTMPLQYNTITEDGRVIIKGITESYATVTINNTVYTADENGRFEAMVVFGSAYATTINVEIRDRAGNVSNESIKITNLAADLKDIIIEASKKDMYKNTSQQLFAYESIGNDEKGERLSNTNLKFDILQGSEYASISDEGILTANKPGEIAVEAKFMLNNTDAITDTMIINILGEIVPNPSYDDSKDETEVDKILKQFTDVDKHWAREAIAFVVKNGLFNGTGNGKFEPNTSTTRAMMVTVLYRYAQETLENTENKFSDVPSDMWYSDAVVWAEAMNIVQGVGNNKFSPDSKVTREQIAVILANYIKYLDLELEFVKEADVFADYDEISDWAKDAVIMINRLGLLNGKGDGILDPTGYATRAEMATLFQRLAELMGKYK